MNSDDTENAFLERLQLQAEIVKLLAPYVLVPESRIDIFLESLLAHVDFPEATPAAHMLNAAPPPPEWRNVLWGCADQPLLTLTRNASGLFVKETRARLGASSLGDVTVAARSNLLDLAPPDALNVMYVESELTIRIERPNQSLSERPLLLWWWIRSEASDAAGVISFRDDRSFRNAICATVSCAPEQHLALVLANDLLEAR